jgi:hypothetical protein
MDSRFIQRNEKLISLSLLAAVILVWTLVFFTEFPYHQPTVPFTDYSLELYEGCHIEYGRSECIDGNLVTSFYNSGNEDLTNVSMHFREGEDIDIYNCNEILEPDTTGTLTTIPCTGDVDMSKIWLVWCCGDECSDTYMTEVSDDLTLIY